MTSELDKERLLSDSPEARASDKSSFSRTFIPWVFALAMLLANLVLLQIAASRFAAILRELEGVVDNTDTRALPRPDPLYKFGNGH